MISGIKTIRQLMKSKIFLTLLFTWIFGTSIACAKSPLIFQENLIAGVDEAFKSAFDKAVSSIAPGEKLDISIDDMYVSCQSVSIDNDKLSVAFDADKVKQILNSQGISSWEGMSEPVLMWLSDGKTIFGADNDNALVKDILEKAEQKRYKIMLPLMDLDDIQAVSSEAILNHDVITLAKASDRYGCSFFIVGLLSQDEAGLPQIKWEVLDNKAKSLDGAVSKGENISKDMAAGIADILMKNTQNSEAVAASDDYFVLGAGPDFVRILITNVQNVADYDKIVDILVTYGYSANSPIVARTGEGIILEIKTGASVDILDGTLAHGGDFTKIASWTYSFNKSAGAVSAGRSSIGKGSADLIRSTIEIKEADIGAVDK